MTETWRGTSGIYEIANTVTGVRYFGSARCLATRFVEHRTALQRGRHENIRLQHAWNKYGAESFAFNVLAVLEHSDLLKTEQRLVTLLFGKKTCYNIRRDVSPAMYGKSMPESAKAKLSSDRKGRVFTPEHCAKIAASKRGKPGHPHTAETRAKISAAHKGKKFSAARRAALSAAHIGKPLSAEQRTSLSAAKRGKRKSPEHKAALRVSTTNWWATTENRSRPTMRNPETREKIAAKQRANWAARKARNLEN